MESHDYCVLKKKEKKKSLKETNNMSAQDVMEYLILDVELEKAKERVSVHEKNHQMA